MQPEEEEKIIHFDPLFNSLLSIVNVFLSEELTKPKVTTPFTDHCHLGIKLYHYSPFVFGFKLTGPG